MEALFLVPAGVAALALVIFGPAWVADRFAEKYTGLKPLIVWAYALAVFFGILAIVAGLHFIG